MILNISYYDVYDGIIITDDCIDVTHGHWPFDIGQKFKRGDDKFMVIDAIYEPHKDKLIKKFVFQYIMHGVEELPERFEIPALQVLKSIKEKRTTFYS